MIVESIPIISIKEMSEILYSKNTSRLDLIDLVKVSSIYEFTVVQNLNINQFRYMKILKVWILLHFLILL